MSKKTFMLDKSQFLTHLGLKIPPNQSFFLIAPTGSGKTSFTMEDLNTQFEFVLILVPTQAKVMELENEYPKVKGSKYLFFCGNKSPDESIRSFKGVVVATYDKFDKVIELMTPLQKKKALLVIDESHKLYSAGSFRDSALTPVIWHLQQRSIPSILFLTATKTNTLFEQLKIKIDQEYIIEHKNPIIRSIEVVSLLKGDQYTCVAMIENRIKQLKKEYISLPKDQRCKTIIVRVNSREKCDNLQRYFEDKFKLKCLVVHSKSKNNVDVREIFETQMIPKGVDIVFTTSIMDEAVNLKNEQIEVDSIFVLGKQAHVEELVQFIGRLRLANVPCYLLLHTEICRTHDDPSKIHEKHIKKLNDFISRVNKIAEALASLAEDYEFDLQDIEKPNIYDKVNRMNESFKEWFGCKLFAVYKGKSLENIASLVSTLYQIDAGQFYSSFEYLKWRIQKFLPNCKISYAENKTLETPQDIKDFFNEQKSNAEQAYAESIDTGIEIFLKHFQTINFKPESLKDISSKFIKNKQQDEAYIEDLVWHKNYQVRHYEEVGQVLNETIYLSQHITNLHDIREILTQKKFREILKVTEAYANNEFIRHIVKQLYGSNPNKYLHGHYTLNGVKASKLLSKTIKAVQDQTHLPMRTIIKENLIKGMRYDYKTDVFDITESKALNFLAAYFEVKDKNKNKPERRYLEFQGIAVGGFEYLSLKDLQAPHLIAKEKFILNEKTYDAYSGQCLTKLTRTLSMEDLYNEL